MTPQEIAKATAAQIDNRIRELSDISAGSAAQWSHDMDETAALILSAAAKMQEEGRPDNIQKIIAIIEPIYDHEKLDALGGQLSYVAERILDRIALTEHKGE